MVKLIPGYYHFKISFCTNIITQTFLEHGVECKSWEELLVERTGKLGKVLLVKLNGVFSPSSVCHRICANGLVKLNPHSQTLGRLLRKDRCLRTAECFGRLSTGNTFLGLSTLSPRTWPSQTWSFRTQHFRSWSKIWSYQYWFLRSRFLRSQSSRSMRS